MKRIFGKCFLNEKDDGDDNYDELSESVEILKTYENIKVEHYTYMVIPTHERRFQ